MENLEEMLKEQLHLSNSVLIKMEEEYRHSVNVPYETFKKINILLKAFYDQNEFLKEGKNKKEFFINKDKIEEKIKSLFEELLNEDSYMEFTIKKYCYNVLKELMEE